MQALANRSFWAAFGPGILFAGAAIGNSHLVQSTRAGALFGLGLLLVVLFANIIKYPAYRMGSLYAAATGRSLIHGYRKLGWPVLFFYALSELVVHGIIIAASALTTAAVSIALFDLPLAAPTLAVILTLVAAGILRAGKFQLLDRLCKVFVAILTVSTFAATLAVLPRVEWATVSPAAVPLDFETFAFVIAVMGFMPAGMSLSVLQSLWVVAKSGLSGGGASVKQVILDLNIGYAASAVLAVCFLLMGAGVMHSEGIEPASRAGPFATQILNLYAASLGQWSLYVVGISVLLVIFTTLLTVIDGFPRMLAGCYLTLFDQQDLAHVPLDTTRTYLVMMGLLIGGSSLLLLLFMQDFTSFIDFVTVTSFLVAPITALLNHLVIYGDDVPADLRPGKVIRWWSLLGIAFLTITTLVYLAVRISQ